MKLIKKIFNKEKTQTFSTFDSSPKNSETEEQVVKFEIKNVMDARLPAKHLISNNSVLVDFTNLSNDDRNKAFIFLNGAAFVTGAQYEKIESKVYLFTKNK